MILGIVYDCFGHIVIIPKPAMTIFGRSVRSVKPSHLQIFALCTYITIDIRVYIYNTVYI